MQTEFSDLYKKYNIPGPRYTSYPTVPYWEDIPTEQEWVSSVADALYNSKSISYPANFGAALYIHIPFCQSLCTYCGCNTRITRNHAVGAPYVRTVLKEWQLYLEKISLASKLSDSSSHLKPNVTEIHLGGGTPTFLGLDELNMLLEGILSTVKVTSDHEFSLEADPRVTTADQLKLLFQYGFRRLSLGIQDFDSRVQEIVHRIQSEEEVRNITETARGLGFNSINYDLIYGLPFQSLDSIRKTIEVVRQHRPDRIAFYSYAHVPWIKPSQRRFTEVDLPSADQKRALYELGRKMLEDAGYIEVGMDHFSLETDPLLQATKKQALHRNFMGYTSRLVSPLIGLGVSAIGDSWSMFAQNEKHLETYQTRVEKGELPIFRGHKLSAEDLILRRHILNLMTKFETDLEIDLDKQLKPIDYLTEVEPKLQEAVRDELMQIEGTKITVTDRGRPFLRNICMAFDARLNRKAPQTRIFSQTI